ncbi:hypothetical protein DPMN_174794 [Dreissena polymorpha]|uniref:Uncharacterized protein n=1 Tax=Dreissena polymorpha TaxID=45954 RepID=A0A9D4IIX1_DREPO|nr:hypothetical protein DPMN_174794 [Dreissena polymorpha]
MARQRPTRNFRWARPMLVGPRDRPCVIRDLKQKFGWAWSMWAGRPRIDRIVIRDVQYQIEVNQCRNEEVNFQGSSAHSVGGDSGQDGRTDGGDNHNIPTLLKALD